MIIAAMKAADLLSWSRRTRVRLPGFPADIQPQTLEQGYAIQLAAARQRSATPSGFKVGLTSETAQRAARTGAPIAGRLALADIVRAPARLTLDAQHLRVVEAEVVFEMGADLPATRAPFSEADMAACIRGAFAGLEICDSRFVHCDDLPLPHIVADNSNADRLVIGDALADWSRADLAVTLARRGEPLVTGSTAQVLGHPLRSLVWLANWLAASGESLRCGQWVATGSCTGITQVAASDHVVATFGTAARVSVELVPETGRAR